MTANELRAVFNSMIEKNGIEWKPPSTFEVDHETYANVVQSIFNNKAKKGDVYRLGYPGGGLYYEYHIQTGVETNGIMFKNIELVLKEFKE